MELKNFFAQDNAGNILSSAICYLYERGSESLAPTVVNSNGLAMSNPFSADQHGFIQFAAPNGIYDLRVVKEGRDSRIRVQCNDVMETTAAIETAVRVLQDKLADPSQGAGMVGRSTIVINSISSLRVAPLKVDLILNVKSYFSGWEATVNGPYGGGQFCWDANRLKSEHDGGKVISPSVPWNGSMDSHENFLNAVGETEPLGRGCFVSLSDRYSIWEFGAIKFLNNGTNTSKDSTYAVQKALFSAKKSLLTATHTVSKLATVYCCDGDVLIGRQLVFPEGIVLEGGDKISSRLCFSWGMSTKIVSYGRIHDQLNGNPAGTTYTKNWGLKNVSLMPYYPDPGPDNCIYLDYLYDIEPLLHNVRMVMHKGAVKGGQLNATAINFKKTIDPSFIDVTFDGGLNHIYGLDSTYGWGVMNARLESVYSYNVKSHAVILGDGSDFNIIDIAVQMPEQVGDNRAVFLSGSASDNDITVTASGVSLKYGAVIEGVRNKVRGTLGGSVLGVDVRGKSNRVDVTLAAESTWRDTGESSELRLPDFTKVAGESKGVKRAIIITNGIWKDVALITFATGAGHSAVVSASVTSEVTGLGRDCYSSTWLVGQNTAGEVTGGEATAPFNPAGYLKLRLVSAGVNKAKIQAQLASGVSTIADVPFSMRADQYAQIMAL